MCFDILIYSKFILLYTISKSSVQLLCFCSFEAINLLLQIDLSSLAGIVCAWSSKFCRISTREISLLMINKTFFLWLQQDICCLHCQREDSDCYRSGIQKICELLRIQITTSVNCSEGASSAKNGY